MFLWKSVKRMNVCPPVWTKKINYLNHNEISQSGTRAPSILLISLKMTRLLLSPQGLNILSSYQIQVLSRNQDTLTLSPEKYGALTADRSLASLTIGKASSRGIHGIMTWVFVFNSLSLHIFTTDLDWIWPKDKGKINTFHISP